MEPMSTRGTRFRCQTDVVSPYVGGSGERERGRERESFTRNDIHKCLSTSRFNKPCDTVRQGERLYKRLTQRMYLKYVYLRYITSRATTSPPHPSALHRPSALNRSNLAPYHGVTFLNKVLTLPPSLPPKVCLSRSRSRSRSLARSLPLCLS